MMRCKKRKEGPGDSLVRNRNKGKSVMDSCTLEMMVVGVKEVRMIASKKE